MIPTANFGLLWFGSFPRLPLRRTKASLRLLVERETKAMGMVYTYGDEVLYMQSWNNLKYLDQFCWRQTLWEAFFFFVSFFASYFSLPWSATTLHCASEVDYWSRIWVLLGGDKVVIILQSNLILLQYLHLFFLHFLKGNDASLPHSVVRCGLEDNITRWLLNPPLLRG